MATSAGAPDPAPPPPQQQPPHPSIEADNTTEASQTTTADGRRRPGSPPQPQRHTAATPGYRVERLQLLYSKSLDRVLSKLAWDNFAGCYPTVASRADGVLRQVQGQMVTKLREKCEKEFENIIAARQLVPKLNELEHLIEGAQERRNDSMGDLEPTPPHLLPPSQILTAHLTPVLAQHQSQLNAKLQTTQSQNASLFDQVKRQRAEIDELLRHLETAVEDVKSANGTLDGLVDELSGEARDVEAELAKVGEPL